MNYLKKSLMVIVGLLLSTNAGAYDFKVDGIYYNITDETNKTVVVTHCDSYSDDYTGSVTIPSSVTFGGTTYSVISIGNGVFSGCTGLTSVTIPNSVTSIGNVAFQGCTGLTSVTIPNSVTSIGLQAFSNTGWYNNQPDGVIYLGKVLYKYKGTMPLNTSIAIKEGIVSISSEAFEDCTGLISVSIPNSVTMIDNCAFDGCTSLTSVSIPNSMTKINYRTFAQCSGLTSVSISNSVTEIDERAFYLCEKLKTIVALNPTPPTFYSDTFNSINYSNATLYVPKDSYAKYFIDVNWGKFTSIKKIETLASSISLTKETITLEQGASETITAIITPTNTTLQSVEWTSDNPSVATVDQSGKITAKKGGTATIMAKAIDGSDVSASCNVIVNNTKVTLSQSEANIPVNEILILSYNIVPVTTIAEWSTSNANIAPIKVNNDGTVSVVGLADGVSTITATAIDGSGASASCVVTVGVGSIQGVEVDDNAVEVARYDIYGHILNSPTEGINIIKLSDGTTKKELVK